MYYGGMAAESLRIEILKVCINNNINHIISDQLMLGKKSKK